MTVLVGWLFGLLGMGAPPDLEPDWLQWRAPASCPDAELAKAATRRRLGREATSADTNVLATIELHGEEHQRVASGARRSVLRAS